MKKRMIIMIASVGIFFAALIGFNTFKGYMMKQWLAGNGLPPATVTTMPAAYAEWQPEIRSVGTLRALHGVDVVSEVAGIVSKLHFKSGDSVKTGALLVELDAGVEKAQLHAAQAAAELAAITFKRDKAQFKVKAVSQAQLDLDQADLKAKKAQVAQLQAVLNKMRIRAPFAGMLGVSAISLGQYLKQAQVIVSLQENDPILVDFNVPQGRLAKLKVGQRLHLNSNSIAGHAFSGEISAIDSRVNANTRNVRIEAKVDNAKGELLPGMYAEVRVETGERERYLTLPQTAVSYNAYGSTIFRAKVAATTEPTSKQTEAADGKPALPVAEQVFVKTGLRRGDQIAVLSGIKEGDVVVTSGQMKLKNGTPMIVNNSVQPAFDAAPKPQEH